MSLTIHDDMKYMKCKSVKKKSNITNMSLFIHDDMLDM